MNTPTEKRTFPFEAQPVKRRQMEKTSQDDTPVPIADVNQLETTSTLLQDERACTPEVNAEELAKIRSNLNEPNEVKRARVCAERNGRRDDGGAKLCSGYRVVQTRWVRWQREVPMGCEGLQS